MQSHYDTLSSGHHVYRAHTSYREVRGYIVGPDALLDVATNYRRHHRLHTVFRKQQYKRTEASDRKADRLSSQ